MNASANVFSALASTVVAPKTAKLETPKTGTAKTAKTEAERLTGIFASTGTVKGLMKAIWTATDFLTVDCGGVALPVIKSEVIQYLRGLNADAAAPFVFSLAVPGDAKKGAKLTPVPVVVAPVEVVVEPKVVAKKAAVKVVKADPKAKK